MLTEDGSISKLTHIDDEGAARMVDVSGKDVTERTAIATALVRMKSSTLELIRSGSVPKGNAIEVARIAGIGAAKRTAELIPLCHTIRLTNVAVDCAFPDGNSVLVTATAKALDRTGVEMEALTAAATAALTIYDMCKAVDREMIIAEIKLVKKTGGKSGEFTRQAGALP